MANLRKQMELKENRERLKLEEERLKFEEEKNNRINGRLFNPRDIKTENDQEV